MTISLHYTIAKPAGELPSDNPSRVLEVLQEAFGGPNPRLDREALPVLRALSKAMPSEGVFAQLERAIGKYGAIEIGWSS